jgi:Uma2 family endonuclease
VVLAKLGGEDRPSGIADWIAHRRETLQAAHRSCACGERITGRSLTERCGRIVPCPCDAAGATVADHIAAAWPRGSAAMIAATQWTRATQDEYLTAERDADYKSEYIDGYVVAMSGASRPHNILSLRIGALLDAALADSPCEVYSSDMRVKVSETGDYTYPDVVVACGDIAFEDAVLDTLLTPTVIVEVLSPSTEGYDRGLKFERYRQIASLQEFILVAQDRVLVEHYLRREDGWLYTAYDAPELSLQLPSVGCTLPLAQIYRKVRFPTERPPRH